MSLLPFFRVARPFLHLLWRGKRHIKIMWKLFLFRSKEKRLSKQNIKKIIMKDNRRPCKSFSTNEGDNDIWPLRYQWHTSIASSYCVTWSRHGGGCLMTGKPWVCLAFALIRSISGPQDISRKRISPLFGSWSRYLTMKTTHTKKQVIPYSWSMKGCLRITHRGLDYLCVWIFAYPRSSPWCDSLSL